EVSGSEVRIEFNGLSILLDCVGVVACQVIAKSYPRADHKIERIEFQCPLSFSKRLVMAAADRKIVSIPVVRVCILGVQLLSAPELGFRSGPIPTMAHGKAQRRVGFGRLWIDLECFACRGVSFRECLGWGLKSVPC